MDVFHTLNHFPFAREKQSLVEMVQRLKEMAHKYNQAELIYGRGQTAEEKKTDKQNKYNLIRFYYLSPKGKQKGFQPEAKK